MNFGEKLKLLRQERQWSQPEMAERIGIEQSYLSKLETGKALPSNELLQRIMQVLPVELGTLLQNLDKNHLHRELRSLPLVAGYLAQQKSHQLITQKRWLAGWSCCCVLGLSLLIAGLFGLLFPNESYQYQSVELVPKGAQGEIFTSLDTYIQYAIGPQLLDSYSDDIAQVEYSRLETNAYQRVWLQLQNLRYVDYMTSSTDRGAQFTRDQSSSVRAWDALTASGIETGASRTYVMTASGRVFKFENRILTFLGVFLLLCGAFSLLAERRLTNLTLAYE